MLTTFNDWRKELDRKEVEAFKQRIESEQITLGKLLEINFIKMADQIADWNKKIDITKASKELDLLFGADFKVTYNSLRDEDVNNMSIHIDITSNPFKKGLWILQENVFTMSNGITVSYGVKFSNRYFYYNKPVVVFVLNLPPDGFFNPIFTQEDVITAIYKAEEIAKFISYRINYKFANEWKYGGGKRASEIVYLKSIL